MSTAVVLVTGATGFIGSHLAERLVRDGRRVRVLCRPGSETKLTPALARGVEIAHGDLRDAPSLVRACRGAARVFHAAGNVLDWGALAEFAAINVEGTRLLLEAAREAGVGRVVHFSSFVVFGTPSPPSFDDDSPYGEGADPYTRTKIEGEKVALDFAAHGLPVVVLRPPVVYGPRGTWLEEPLAMARQNKLFLVGGGRGTCHPCYVENLVDAALLTAEHPRAIGRAYMMGDGCAITFREYFDAIAALAGRGPLRRSIPLFVARATATAAEAAARVTRSATRPLLTHAAIDLITTTSRMSTARIENELGFRPRRTFVEAMARIGAEVTPASAWASPSA